MNEKDFEELRSVILYRLNEDFEKIKEFINNKHAELINIISYDIKEAEDRQNNG